MLFQFDKAACQNTRRALRKEWLLTNGLGDYASSTILGCNTRKYHGLLVVNTESGRQVLLSGLEESVAGGGKEFFFSCRQHPQTMYPNGNAYLERFCVDRIPTFTYRVGDVRLKRQIMLLQGKSRVIVRWSIEGSGGVPKLTLRVKPLLAYRSFHALTHENAAINTKVADLKRGFSISPYKGMPDLVIESGSDCSFASNSDWCRNVEYLVEGERGFDFSEDLFMPGVMEIELPKLPDGGSVYITAGLEPLATSEHDLAALWDQEFARQAKYDQDLENEGGMIGHLARVGDDFCIKSKNSRAAVLAGYHWFDAWGRDTLIALPGLAFCSGRPAFGKQILAQMGQTMRDGLIPNCFADDGNHAWNSADASLWYAFAVQSLLRFYPDELGWVRENAWPVLKSVIEGYRKGPGMDIHVDGDWILHAGNATTQLTWMDANVNGKPVTPRYGCPVELNALWYNTLAFVDRLSRQFDESYWSFERVLRPLRETFLERFWVFRNCGHLADGWRDGDLDRTIRPNQILAVSLPEAVVDEEHQPQIVECVRLKLLTPYGLRTLAPDEPGYRGHYEGDSESRDSAYHQGTVWPWLLGHYADALLRVAWDKQAAVAALLDKVTPLFTEHLADACLGGISEVFDASPPYRPNGCVHQAWSVAECQRMLYRMREEAPHVYADWERKVANLLANPRIGDTAGICRVTMPLREEKVSAVVRTA